MDANWYTYCHVNIRTIIDRLFTAIDSFKRISFALTPFRFANILHILIRILMLGFLTEHVYLTIHR